MNKFKYGIRLYIITRLLISFLLILIMCVILILLLRQNMMRESIQKNALMAGLYESTIKISLARPIGVINEIHLLLHELPGGARNGRNTVNRVLGELIRPYRFISGVSVIGRDGMEKYVAPSGGQSDYLDLSTSPVFTKALHSDKPYWSPTFISPESGDVSVTLSRLYDVGVIAVYLDLSQLKDNIMGIGKSSGATVSIVDGNGNYIFHQDEDRVSRRETDRFYLDFRREKGTNSGNYTAFIDNEEYLITAINLDEPEWTVLVSTPFSAIYRLANQGMYFLLFAAGLTIILSIFLTGQMVNTLSGVFSKFIDQAKEITKGNYYLHMRQEQLAEFNELAEQFNKMAQEIQNREKAILISQNRYRSLFDNAAVSIIEFDFSGIAKCIGAMKERGVTDFRKYLEDNPEEIRNCLDKVQIIDMNRRTADFLKIGERKLSDFMIQSLFPPEAQGILRGMLLQIIEGRQTFEAEIPVFPPDGSPITIIASGSVVPGYEKSLSRVIFSTIDITERKLSALETDRENRDLREMVESAVNKLREKDRLMLYQSRMAAMGEMLRNIAHQWRQPLNALGINIQNTLISYQKKQLNADYLKSFIDRSMNLILHMSKTIDDFRNFFKPDKEPAAFPLRDVIEKALSIVEASYANNFIRLETVYLADMTIKGYPNEYSQVLLVILNNAKDILTERKITNPLVRITLQEMYGKSVVTITDNAGGIGPNYIMKIFEPYFTTKPEGTGIGLYMSKMIIESNMGGKLTVQNVEGGAEFRIVI